MSPYLPSQGQDVVVRRYIPPSCSTRDSLLALSSSNKHRWRVFPPPKQPEQRPPWRGTVASSESRGSTPSVRSRTDQRSDQRLSVSREAISSPGTQSREATLESLVEPLEPELADNEHFPGGYRGETRHESGWLDYACGPSISINITYHSHLHDVKPDPRGRPHPNALVVDVDAPTVLFRVFGSFGRDLLALKVCLVGGSCILVYFVVSLRLPNELITYFVCECYYCLVAMTTSDSRGCATTTCRASTSHWPPPLPVELS